MTAPQRPTPRTDELIWQHVAEQNTLKDCPVSFGRLSGLTAKQYTQMAEHAQTIERSLSEREEECERLREDARRYRWLRLNQMASIYKAVVVIAGDGAALSILANGTDLDFAIDNAMSKPRVEVPNSHRHNNGRG